MMACVPECQVSRGEVSPVIGAALSPTTDTPSAVVCTDDSATSPSPTDPADSSTPLSSSSSSSHKIGETGWLATTLIALERHYAAWGAALLLGVLLVVLHTYSTQLTAQTRLHRRLDLLEHKLDALLSLLAAAQP